MNRIQIFETDRLYLRPMSITDAPFLLVLLNTPKWIKNIGDRNVKDVEAAEKYIKDKVFPQQQRLGYSNYVMTLKSNGTKIGTCGLYDRDGLEGVDIGFAMLPDFEKRGYAFEAAIKIKQVGVEVFGIKTISAITIKSNVDSQRLIEKLGLQFVKMINLPDDPEELMLYRWEQKET